MASVNVALRAGLTRVARLALSAGLGNTIEPTPSMALGSYEVTPLDLAAAYTVFANHGDRLEPYFIDQVQNERGEVLFKQTPTSNLALDPRVAYLVTNLLQDVINRGTGYGVRRAGFREASAGKTGTDDDGWFVGYTPKLLCLVWVGFDDNRDLQIEVARSALPIWAEFMKQAHTLEPYSDPGTFEKPSGIVTVTIDPESGLLAGNSCPRKMNEVLIRGTEPRDECWLHRGGFLRRLFGSWSRRDERAPGTMADDTIQPVRRLVPDPGPLLRTPVRNSEDVRVRMTN